ncbi:MAG: hypothetical protein QOC71_1677, partial [Thermoplasmata archaeon]|nr:hypothetical protein [Thermoplasmata archaeon]
MVRETKAQKAVRAQTIAKRLREAYPKS